MVMGCLCVTALEAYGTDWWVLMVKGGLATNPNLL